jgi:3-methyladenine DNA glycosylase AlkD
MTDVDEVISLLKEKSNPEYLAGMKRFGIDNTKALGIPVPELRKLAKVIRKDHALALQLWQSGLHEARLFASMIDDPAWVTTQQMDAWVNDFNSWDICDQACGNLFDRTPYALVKAVEYSSNEKEFVKRAGFVLMAEYAMHHKKAHNAVFIDLLPIIEREAWDNRNFVKKAVNWALRQIGKRNAELKIAAVESANRIANQNSKAAKWIASGALTELAKKFPNS